MPPPTRCRGVSYGASSPVKMRRGIDRLGAIPDRRRWHADARAAATQETRPPGRRRPQAVGERRQVPRSPSGDRAPGCLHDGRVFERSDEAETRATGRRRARRFRRNTRRIKPAQSHPRRAAGVAASPSPGMPVMAGPSAPGWPRVDACRQRRPDPCRDGCTHRDRPRCARRATGGSG